MAVIASFASFPQNKINQEGKNEINIKDIVPISYDYFLLGTL